MSDLLIIESCEGCGACCLEQESPPGYVGFVSGIFPIDDSEDAQRFQILPQSVKDELATYVSRIRSGAGHPNNRICIWFDEQTRQCKHYEHRPHACREFVQVGDEYCREWRRRHFTEALEKT